MLGLEPTKVQLVPYDPQWPIEFDKERLEIEKAIGADILSVDHIGSTSIPGLCAKPIIDILIGLKDFGDGFRCVSALEKLGYTFRGEHGIPGRHYFRKGSPRTHHLHMYTRGTPDWQHHILFRDYLRAHAAQRDSYAELKTALAKQYPENREKYLDGKAAFIQNIIQLAKYAKMIH
jgi:GrpB-like predicted nucleotidyltransferase (UPF0157 family)